VVAVSLRGPDYRLAYGWFIRIDPARLTGRRLTDCNTSDAPIQYKVAAQLSNVMYFDWHVGDFYAVRQGALAGCHGR
jgi:hypothetical protein